MSNTKRYNNKKYKVINIEFDTLDTFDNVKKYLWKIFEIADDWTFEYAGKYLERKQMEDVINFIKKEVIK